MNWKKKAFENFKLYGVTDLRNGNRDILKKIEAAYRGGTDIVQLRSKSLSDGALFKLGLQIRKLADVHRKLFFVNNRPDLAILLKADGVHLGQDDLSISAVRKLAGRSGAHLWIGKSTHTLRQALGAVNEGADYIGVGPVFKTPTKPDYPSTGLGFVRQASKRIKIPFVAIGGINETNLSEVVSAGARRVAVVRALFGGNNAYGAAKKLREEIEKFWK